MPARSLRRCRGSYTLPPDPIAPPAAAGTVELRPARPVFAHIGHGCGNAAAVEITKRFPPRLGNLAQNARFPHSHSRLSCEGGERTKAKDQDSTARSLDTR